MSELSTEEAKKVIQEESKKRCDECSRELQALLDRYNCTIDIDAILNSRTGIQFSVKMISK